MPIGKMVSLFILPLGIPEICQNPPTCGQDDLVFFASILAPPVPMADLVLYEKIIRDMEKFY
jgi:hypothetical protein